MIESVDQLPKICFNTPLLGPGMNIHRRVVVCGHRLQTRTAGTSLSAEDTAIPATSLPQNPSKALCYVLSARNLSLGEVSDLAFRQTSYHSPHVRNKFRIRRRPFDREWDSSFPAGCSRNLRQTTHHAPVQISEHLESQVACRADRSRTCNHADRRNCEIDVVGSRTSRGHLCIEAGILDGSIRIRD